MSIISRMRRQWCVYWAPGATADSYGQPTYDAPVALRCRWEDGYAQYVGPDATRVVRNARVFTSQAVKVDGVLWLMPIGAGVDGVARLLANTDALNLTEPLKNDGAFTIKEFEGVPNLRATETLQLAYL